MGTNVNLTKWLPKQHNDRLKLFQESRALVRNLRALGKKFATEINVDLPDYYVSKKKNFDYLYKKSLNTPYDLKVILLF